MAEKSYRLTRLACYGGCFSQATVNMFLPLLYVSFHTVYGISLSMVALLGTVNFAVQLVVDLLAAGLTNKISFRASALLAHACVIAGFILLVVLPFVLPPFAGLLIAVCVYAVGGGLEEVIISPIIESCPAPDKKRQMGLLHATYPLGAVGMLAFSAAFFALFGVARWRIAALILTAVPLVTFLLFTVCPFAPQNEPSEGEESTEGAAKKPRLFSSFSFYLFLLLMICAGASEQAIAQWISAYAELSLGIGKTMSDIFGPLAFMLVFAAVRLLYAVLSERIATHRILLFSGVLTVGAFLLAALAPNPIANLAGCLLAAVGIAAMWPAVLSLAAASLSSGTTTFSLLAFGGDIGCGVGTYCIGGIGTRTSLHTGMLCGTAFPLLFTLAILAHTLVKKEKK